MPKIQRIRWSQQEINVIVEAAAQRMQSDPSLLAWEAVRLVQKDMLPRERQRDVLGAKWVTEGMTIAIIARAEDIRHAKDKVDVREYHKVIEERDSLRRQVSELMSGMSSLREQVQFYEAQPKAPTAMEVMAQFVADIVRRAREPEAQVTASPVAVQVRHNPEPKGEEDDRAPKIVVVGLLPRQQNELSEAINGKARLKFWKDGSLPQLESMARNADRTFLAVDWIDHKAENAVRAVTEHFEKFKGGAPRAKTAIEDWLGKRTA